ncbi:fatty-acyl-CoA synthase [Pseudomonas benzenivorans]|nr:long-chain-fatty-acid--CoA ligase [Pseudomonas benzenivorans]SDI16460.1 fatty-acyl-CoA synthase [Pseudomonas benzenivorans]
MAELTLADIARATANTRPDQTALVFGDKSTTVHELDARANQVANGLMAFGVTDQERVAILDHSSDQFYEIWLGAARANLAIAPLNSRLSTTEVIQVVNDSHSRVLFVGLAFVEMIEQVRSQLKYVDHIIVMGDEFSTWRDQQSAMAFESTMTPADDCLQMYTSGTTGLPKGVRLTSENVFKGPMTALENRGISPCTEIGSKDVILLCLPHAHVAGSILGIYGLVMGAKLIICRDFVPADIVSTIEREQVTLTLMVPVMVRGLIAAMEKTGIACKSLKTILYGAAPMATSLLKDAMKALPHSGFGQIYGLTETSGPVTFLTPDDHRSIAAGNNDLALSCGSATAGVELQVINHYGQPVPPGGIGEIICRSPQIMKGYWNRTEDTLSAIQDGWFYTGDVGYIDDKGYVYIYDRKRDMIITGGENVYPAEVENVLYEHPAIADVAIIGVPDAQWGEAVKAVAVLKPGAVLSAEDLIAYAKGKIAGFKIPKSVDFVEELPRNATGKVLRRLIREPYWKAHARGVA